MQENILYIIIIFFTIVPRRFIVSEYYKVALTRAIVPTPFDILTPICTMG